MSSRLGPNSKTGNEKDFLIKDRQPKYYIYYRKINTEFDEIGKLKAETDLSPYWQRSISLIFRMTLFRASSLILICSNL
jgi:hypothetical protein